MEVLIDGEIVLNGPVGNDFFQEGFTSMDVMIALAKLRGKDVVVHLNSGGGYTHEGTAIYNALKAHNGKITIFVDGVAYSIASLILQAGDDRIMRTGSVVMVHDPATFTEGDLREHLIAVADLEATADSMCDVYAARTGRPFDEVRQEMKDTIWLTADEAVAKKYADRKDTARAITAASFYMSAYKPQPAFVASATWPRLRKEVPVATNNPQDPNPTPQPTPTPTPAPAPAPVPNPASPDPNAATAAADAERNRCSQITTICATAGAPEAAGHMISQRFTVEQAQARASDMKAIKETVTRARAGNKHLPDSLLTDYLSAGKSLTEVQADLFNRLATAQEQQPTNGHREPRVPSAQNNKAQADVDADWDESFRRNSPAYAAAHPAR